MRISLLAIIVALLAVPAPALDQTGPADPAELEVFLAGLLRKCF